LRIVVLDTEPVVTTIAVLYGIAVEPVRTISIAIIETIEIVTGRCTYCYIIIISHVGDHIEEIIIKVITQVHVLVSFQLDHSIVADRETVCRISIIILGIGYINGCRGTGNNATVKRPVMQIISVNPGRTVGSIRIIGINTIQGGVAVV
jgi:hypothetical protein